MKTLSSTWIILPLVLLTAVTGCQAEQRADARQRPEPTRDQLQEQLGAPPSEVDVSIARELSGAFRAAAHAALPAVVFIRVEKPAGGDSPAQQIPEPFRRFFGIPEDQGEMPPQQGLGSGFLIDQDGHIITNAHVVSGASYVNVRLVDGREFEAEVVGSDSSTDVAVLRIDSDGELPVAELGSSDQLRVGDWVLALGSPLGLDFTVTTGIISAKGRRISAREGTLEAFLQTDAAINPGNSGGPLVDLTGKVVGVNTAIYGGRTFVGYGFAIPVDLTRRIVSDLLEYGEVRRPRLGVRVSDVTAVDAEAYGLDEVAGAEVNTVEDGSPAAEAGLELGDVVVAIDGDPVADASELVTTLARMRPGDEVELGVVRDGDRRSVTVELGQFEAADDRAGEQGRGAEGVQQKLGFRVEPLTPEIAAQLGLDRSSGPVVAEVAPFSAAANAGIRPGMVVLEVNGETVDSPRDVASAARDIEAGRVVSLRLLVPRLGETIVNYRPR